MNIFQRMTNEYISLLATTSSNHSFPKEVVDFFTIKLQKQGPTMCIETGSNFTYIYEVGNKYKNFGKTYPNPLPYEDLVKIINDFKSTGGENIIIEGIDWGGIVSDDIALNEFKKREGWYAVHLVARLSELAHELSLHIVILSKVYEHQYPRDKYTFRILDADAPELFGTEIYICHNTSPGLLKVTKYKENEQGVLFYVGEMCPAYK